MLQRQAQRRQQLLAAGLAVIGTVGFHAATVKAVCAEAGLTERYFYESFANGEALLRAVYAQQTQALQARVQAALARSAPQPHTLAATALHEYFATLQNPAIARVTLFEVLGVSPAVDADYREVMDHFAAVIAAITRSLNPPTSTSPGHEALVSAGLVGAVVQIGMRWTLSGYREPLETVVASAMTIYGAVAQSWGLVPPMPLVLPVTLVPPA